jgi:hypothetical protein
MGRCCNPGCGLYPPRAVAQQAPPPPTVAQQTPPIVAQQTPTAVAQ